MRIRFADQTITRKFPSTPYVQDQSRTQARLLGALPVALPRFARLTDDLLDCMASACHDIQRRREASSDILNVCCLGSSPNTSSRARQTGDEPVIMQVHRWYSMCHSVAQQRDQDR